jgi:hypothetical protein
MRWQMAGRIAWKPSDPPGWLNSETYTNAILPRLEKIPPSFTSKKLEISEPYATTIRAGQRSPHPRRWQDLARLTIISPFEWANAPQEATKPAHLSPPRLPPGGGLEVPRSQFFGCYTVSMIDPHEYTKTSSQEQPHLAHGSRSERIPSSCSSGYRLQFLIRGDGPVECLTREALWPCEYDVDWRSECSAGRRYYVFLCSKHAVDGGLEW